MGNFVDLSKEYPEPPGAPELTPDQIAFDKRISEVPVSNLMVQWQGDMGFVANQFGQLIDFTRAQFVDWFDRKKAAFEYHATNGQVNAYSNTTKL